MQMGFISSTQIGAVRFISIRMSDIKILIIIIIFK